MNGRSSLALTGAFSLTWLLAGAALAAEPEAPSTPTEPTAPTSTEPTSTSFSFNAAVTRRTQPPQCMPSMARVKSFMS